MVKLYIQNREEYVKEVLHALNQKNRGHFRELFLELHPSDRADLYQSVHDDWKEQIRQCLSADQFAELFQLLAVERQMEYVDKLDRNFLVEVLNNMYADDKAALINQLPEETADSLLQAMKVDDAADVQTILAQEEDSAGSLMTTEYISITTNDSVSNVLAMLRERGRDAETIYYLYVVNGGGRLVGVVSLRDLITSDLDAKVQEIMSTKVVSVRMDTDREEVGSPDDQKV